MRRGSSSHDVIRVCPICLAANLEEIRNPFLGILSPPTYKCQRCRYQGPIFAEIEQNEYEKLDLMNEIDSSSVG
jgi:hypothetical protein